MTPSSESRDRCVAGLMRRVETPGSAGWDSCENTWNAIKLTGVRAAPGEAAAVDDAVAARHLRWQVSVLPQPTHLLPVHVQVVSSSCCQTPGE